MIDFPTVTTHTGLAIATDSPVWPALRAFEDGGISAWDDFLVYTSGSRPVITLTLSNSVLASGNPATFNALADGPGAIILAWYTNNVLAVGATNTSYTTPPVSAGFTNVAVVARNANGSTTNAASITVVAPELPEVESDVASNLQPGSAELSGQIVSTGNATTTVNLYYGTSNGGTNAAGWANVVPLGAQTGAFSQLVTLTASTNYYFTFEALNSVGVAWVTPSRSFTTPNALSAVSFFGDGTNWTINQEGITSANISGNVFHGTDGGQNEWVTAWYNNQVYINGFIATFTYQNVGGSPGNDADGASFDLQESGPSDLSARAGPLAAAWASSV